EESLRESEAKYRSLFENMAEEVHFWKVVRDADGRIKTWQVVDVNPPTLKTWGRESIEETIGKTADEIFPGATAHYMPVVQKIMAERVPYSFEDYLPPPVDKYFRFTSVPFGEYFITTGADITQRRHAEESLRQINERLEQIVIQRTRLYLLVASINEAIVRQRDRAKLLSEVCRIIVETGGFRLAWIGRLDTSSREVIVEESCGETAYLEGIRIVAADVPEGRGPTGRAIMEDRHIINADFEEDANMLPWRARARAHGIRSSSAFPLRIGGLVTGVLTIYSEKPSFFSEAEISLFLTITDNISFALTALTNEQRRLEAEEALRRINEDLEQRVAVRTHDLEVVNKELEAFSYSVSHDLRSPLRHMSGFVELLQTKLGDSTDQVMKDYMGAIVRASRKMTVLIESLLTFSRIGRSEMKCRKIDLNRLVKVAVAEIRPDTVGRDIKWDIGDMPEVYGDPFLLRLVFINIISNAVKFTGMCDHAEIEIGCKEENGEHLFFVRDNGAGFDMKFAGKLFGVFQRLHTQNEYEGTGIGLANAKRIISRHGGRIWAESAVGRGAAFYFTLPKISMES
ncbi:MAG TPA: ATP-binding protein, partial [Dissulfurispiraceae bacterium]|nr:ATP-binding protein [Dissulfurispiraceae bacterium]